MNFNLQRIKAVASSLLVAAMTLLVGCDEAPLSDEGADYSEFISVSNIDPTFNTVSFDIKSESAVAIAYACVEADGEAMDADRVMEAGVKQGVNQGSFTVTNLKSETTYKLYVVAQIPAMGVVGPQVKEFTTQVNVGEPSSPRAAGIRAVDLGSSSKTNLTWEVTNGDEVGFSLSMVQPTVIMEDVLYEMAKTGVTKEEYIQDFMVTYGYLQVVTEGKGRKQTHSYTQRYTTLPVIPGANYTIYTLAFAGTYADFVADNKDKLEMLEITEVPVTTTEIPRIGNPGVTLETTEEGYIHFRHKVTPNSDAKYWASYFSKKSEFDEFKKRYDDKEGAGQGVKRLKEYVVHSDAEFIINTTEDAPQSGTTEWTVPVGWDQDEIEFSRLAVGLDDNLVAGDDLEETLDMVIPQDNSEPADFTITVSDVGAQSIFVRGRLGKNCAQAFWRAEPKGFFDESLKDEKLSEELGRQLWDEGYAVHRNYEKPSSYDPTTDSYAEFTYDEFWNTFKPYTEYDLCAVGLNTTGGISKPEIVATFTTCGLTYALNFDPYVTITVPQEEVTKTTAVLHYEIEPFDAESGENARNIYREYFFVILEEGDDVLARDEMGQAQYLYSAGNNWANINILGSKETLNWPVAPATTYVCLYASLTGDGRMSRVKSCEFTSANNDGGPNPKFNIQIKKEEVIKNKDNERLYGAVYTVTPNADVRGYKHLFFDEATLDSYYYDTNNKEELEGAFKKLMIDQGLPAVGFTYNENFLTPIGKKMWAVADGFGADETNRMLSYVEFIMKADGTVVINPQIDVKYTGEATTVEPSTDGDDDTSASVRSCAAQADVVRQEIKYLAKPKEVFNVSDSSAETIRKETGIPVYSFYEMSLKTLLRGGEAK